MKFLKSTLFPILILSILVSLQACKAKKAIQKLAPPAENTTPAPVAPPSTQQTAVVTPPPPAPTPAPDYNFSNIQFEFDSGVLKTESYPFLDKAAANMKIGPATRFSLNGYASAEGSDAHNMKLSEDRANSVKAYLVNSGVSANNLTTKGNGENNPIADNTTEAGRALNRRVEIKKQN